MTPQIRLVPPSDCHQSIHRFWYDIYVREMRRHTGDEPHVDHERGEMVDPVRGAADLFVAEIDGSVVGTLQSAYAYRGDLGKYLDLYRIADRTLAALRGISVTGKLMVASEFRSSGLVFRLGAASYRKGLADGITRNYIDSNAHLVALYERLGYREHLGWIEHPDYGAVFSMVLDLWDLPYLRRCRSPLVPTLEAFIDSNTNTNQGALTHEQMA